mmetsp:Transcript_32296/g.47604  ORF Transcript_32296/g.47604 Transcript_32296/m.47604 type:complete len:240 (-) Transcript_32296:181-900(-)
MGRGKLKFKGEEKAKKKKKSSSKKQLGDGVGAINGGGDDAINTTTSSAGTESSTTQQQSVAAAAANSTHQTNSNETAASSTSLQKSPQISQGQGTITTSSTVVTGHGTSFKTQLHVGDALLAQTSKGQEMRVIQMVLSPISISISSAFTSDLKTPTQFKYINKPRDVTRESQAKVAKARMEQEEVEQRAMGTYGNKGEIIYRERTEHGSYRIKREQATTDMTRSDLLSVRAKKKSDRYC